MVDEYIEKMQLFTKLGKWYGNGSKMQIDVMKLVNEMPVADVKKVKHGKWIVCNGIVSCSVCKENSKLEDYDDDAPFGGYAKTNFCPHCGAKMDGRRDT